MQRPASLRSQLILQMVGCLLHIETAPSSLLCKNETGKERTTKAGATKLQFVFTTLTGSAVSA